MLIIPKACFLKEAITMAFCKYTKLVGSWTANTRNWLAHGPQIHETGWLIHHGLFANTRIWLAHSPQINESDWLIHHGLQQIHESGWLIRRCLAADNDCATIREPIKLHKRKRPRLMFTDSKKATQHSFLVPTA